jgi:acyl-CoA synthetase (AMP-forming)/AMP-acid ligase II
MRLEATTRLSPEGRAAIAYRDRAWSGETLTELLDHRAVSQARETAVMDGETMLTWSDVRRWSKQLAESLRDLGIQKGDAVILQLPNWWEHVVIYYALHMVGAVVVQVGVDWRSREVQFALSVGNPKLAFIPSSFRDFQFPAMYRALERGRRITLVTTRGVAPNDCLAFGRLLHPDPQRPLLEAVSQKLGPDEISRVVFTSGTTGAPKAILHTTNTTRFSSRTIANTYRVAATDVALSYLPLSTNAGAVWSLYLPLETGMAVALLDRFSADRAIQTMAGNAVTLFCGSPTALLAICNSDQLDRSRLSRLRLVISSGSSCPPDSISLIRSSLGASFVEVYGMNEIGWATTTNPVDEPEMVDGTVGRPYEGVEAGIVGAEGTFEEPGVPGELVLRSPGMSVGYFDNPELTASTWDEEGWLRTGDYAVMNDAGNITLLSRKKDLIIRGGANVSPREVEEAILTLSAVKEVTVVGIPHDTQGEEVCACVILQSGQMLTLEDLRQHLIPRIAYYKVPTRLEFIESFPVTSVGKVRRNLLRDQILSGASDGKPKSGGG